MSKRDTLVKAFLYSYKASPLLFISGIVCGVVHSLFYVLFTMFMQFFFESLSNEKTGINYVWSTFAWVAFVTIFREIFNGLHNYIGSVIREYALKYNQCLVLKTCQKYTPLDYEKTEILDSINKAKAGAKECFAFVDVFLDLFDFYIPYFLFLGTYLWSVSPSLLFLLILIFVPVFANSVLRIKVFKQHEDTIAIVRRRHLEFVNCFLNIAIFREMIGLGCNSFIDKKRKDALHDWHSERRKDIIKVTKTELYMRIITLFGYFAVMCYLFWMLGKGHISIGCFAALFGSIEIFFDMMQLAVYNNLGNAFQNLAAVNNFLSFVDYHGKQKIGVKMSINYLTLEHISFSYPEGDRVLDDINITINKGEILAIVGENGAGKSTLSKIIGGLYNPDSGSIRINGKEIKDSDVLVSNTSALFQQYGRYSMSLAENITFGKDVEESSINKLLDDAEILYLRDLIDADLGIDFGNRDLSGGQWQRVALARCIHKDGEIVILDEPTSAIDPLEESKLYYKFKDILKGKIGIIITHRIGCAKLADRILVMHNGRVVEQGKHEELMQKKGKYYAMFVSQASTFNGN